MARPNTTEVAGRLMALKYVVVFAEISPPREMLELLSAKWSPEERKEFIKDLEENAASFWNLERSPISVYLSPRERDFAKTTALTMSYQDRIDAGWRLESAQVLMWALGMLPQLPPPDTEANMEILKSPALSPAEEFLASTHRLRPEVEIDRARSIAELWHWRSRMEEMLRDMRNYPLDEKLAEAGLGSFADVVRTTAELAHERGYLDAIDGDFSIRGRAYLKLKDEEWRRVQSVSIERRWALNWLCGKSPNNDWDSTPTDT